ncbi:D-Inositol 3- phosphate glycosyltransferase [Acrasis kona]|uniref:D-Inositol 3- phosphate glycosyltransferase n=1 Tax=Acrasis kona TaxID=1008807 RepID=A0AAW2YVE5_9EUKA
MDQFSSKPLFESNLLQHAQGESTTVVLQVSDFHISGGLEQVVYDVAVVLRSQSFDVILFNCGKSGQPFQKFADDRFKTVSLDCNNEQEYKRQLSIHDAKLVNGHYSVQGAKWCHDVNVLFIQTIHNMYLWLFEPNFSLLLKQHRDADEYTSAYICVSQTVLNYAAYKMNLDKQKMIVIRNGVDESRMDKSCDATSLRRSLGYDENDFLILQSGTIAPLKGQEYVADAVMKARKELDDKSIKLVLAGTIQDRVYARNIAKRDIGGTTINFVGLRKDMNCLLQAIDLYCHPSLLEGWSLAVAEAAYMNKHILTTNTGGSVQLLQGDDPSKSCLNGKIISIIEPPYHDINNVNINTLTTTKYRHFSEQVKRNIVDIYLKSKTNTCPTNHLQDFKSRMKSSHIYKAYSLLFKWTLTGGSISSARRLIKTM